MVCLGIQLFRLYIPFEKWSLESQPARKLGTCLSNLDPLALYHLDLGQAALDPAREMSSRTEFHPQIDYRELRFVGFSFQRTGLDCLHGCQLPFQEISAFGELLESNVEGNF